jgi:hypothetical protein
MNGPAAMGVVSEPTVPLDTAAAALATLITVKEELPARALGLVIAEAAAAFEEVAMVLVQADCPVMAAGMKALAALCMVVMREF